MAAPPRSALALSFEQQQLVDVAKLLRKEADGKQLTKELRKNLRATAQPLVVDLRAAVQAIPSAGGPRNGPALRPAIARAIVPQVRLTGRQTGVSIRVRQTPQVRGFTNAPRRMNRSNFRHPVYGNREVWVTQIGKPRWFDNPAHERRQDFRDDVLAAVQSMADLLASRARSS